MSVESAITEGVAKSFTRSAARAAARNATRKGVAGEVRQSALMNGFKAGLTATNAAARSSLLQLYARSNINQILTKQGLKAAFKEYLKTELEAKLIDASTSLGANLYNLLSGKGKDKGVLKTMTEGLTKSASDRLRKQNTINGKINQENNRKLNNNKTSIKNSLNKVSSVSRELNNIDTEALLKLENTRKKNLLTYRNDLNKLEKNEEKTTLRLDKLKNSLVKASGTLGVVSLLDLIILHLERNEELKGVSVLNKTTNTKLKIAEIKSKLNLASESSHILKNVDDKVALSKSRLKNTTIRSVGKLKKHRKFKMPDFSLFHMYKRYIKLQAAMGLMNLLGQQVDGYNPEDGDLADMGESLASKLDQMGDQGGAKKWINDLSDNVTDWITDRLMDASEYLPDSVKNSDWYDNWVTQKIVPFIASVPNGILRFGSLVIPETAKNETIVGGVRSGFGYFERFFIFPWILNDYFGIDLSLNNNISLTDLIYNALSSNGPAKLIAKGYRFINDLRGKDTSNEYKFQSEYGLGLSDYEYNAIKNLGNIEAIYQNQNYGVDALADQSTDYAIKINPDALYTSGFSALTLQTPMTDIKVAGNYYKHYLNGEKYKGDNSEPDFSGTFNLGKASSTAEGA
jgi:hypothetical protein